MVFSFFHTLVDRIQPYMVPLTHLENKGDFSSVENLAKLVDDAFYLVLIISVILLALVTFFMVFFAVRYRKKKHPSSHEVKESLALEITWTVIPAILVFIMFYVGWINFVPLRRTPADAMDVKVTARMWSWQFEYENGKKDSILKVPVGKPVKLLLTSSDVIHSLFIPEFRIKEDAVPGMETYLWLTSAKMGEYDIFCAEYCGKGHSSMSTKVMVLSGDEFAAWYNSDGESKKASVPANPLGLLDDNGCLECHSLDGSELVGPTFKDLFGRKEVILSQGKEREIIVNEAYVRKSILAPEADIVKGYPDVMPSYEGEFTDKEMEAILNYLKRLQ